VAQVRRQVGPSVIRGGQIGIETCFSRSTPVSLCKYGSTDPAHAFFVYCRIYLMSAISVLLNNTLKNFGPKLFSRQKYREVKYVYEF
jgi:hypothetical protein